MKIYISQMDIFNELSIFHKQLIITAQGSTLDVRFWRRLKSITH